MLISKIENYVLPPGWSRCCLPDFTGIVMGQSPTSDTYNKSGSGVPFFQGKAEFGAVYPTVAKYCSAPNKIALVGATLLSVRAPVGPTNLAKEKCCIGRGLAAIHPVGGISPMFVLYLLRSIETEIAKEGTGSTFSAINKQFIEELEFGLPPLREQQRIVAKIEELFSELDKGIENLKIAQSQLKVYRQALLKHAFEGKLTAQWRAERHAKQSVAPAKAGAQLLNDMDSRLRGNDEVGGGNDKPLETADTLLKRIQQERAQRYQQQLADWEKSPSAPSQALPLLQRGKTTSTASIPPLEKGGRVGISKPKPPKSLPPLTAEELAELPELPEGWGWVKYGDLCSIVRNGISAKPEGVSGTPIFRISAVRPLFFDMTDIRFINNSNGEFDAYYLERGDLVFTRYNGSRHYVGVCAEYRSDKKCLFPDKLVQTRVFPDNISTSYLEKALNSSASRRFVESKIRTTAGQSGISGDDIKNIPVPFCSTDEQMQIVEELECKLSETGQLDQTITASLQQAEALRQSILKKAFAGQLVPQDPNDEPASELLARIKAERVVNKTIIKP